MGYVGAHSMSEHRLQNNFLDLQDKQLTVSLCLYHYLYETNDLDMHHRIYSASVPNADRNASVVDAGFLPEQIPTYLAHTKRLPLHHPD